MFFCHRSSPPHSNTSTQERPLPRQRSDGNHYRSNNYTPDPVPQHQYHQTTSQQQPPPIANHGSHHVDQGFRADSQSSVGPESAYCGSETHDPPLPVQQRMHMATNGWSPSKDHHRKAVPTPTRELRGDYYANGHLHNTPQRNHHHHHHSNLPQHNEYEHEYDHDRQRESDHWSSPQQTMHYQVENSGVNGAIEERPVAVEQKPTDDEDQRGDNVGKLQQFPQKGQRTGSRPMLG